VHVERPPPGDREHPGARRAFEAEARQGFEHCLPYLLAHVVDHRAALRDERDEAPHVVLVGAVQEEETAAHVAGVHAPREVVVERQRLAPHRGSVA
jgi:hypothetical protein